MEREQKLLPTSVSMYVSRATQIVLSIIVLGLDIFVIDEWNQNKFSFNAVAGDSNSNIKTWVGGTPFTGIVMFTAVLTLFIIVYDLVAPRKAMLFYHIYGEIVLELFLIVFWMVSFAGMASYVEEISGIVRAITDFLASGRNLYTYSQEQSFRDMAKNSQASEDCCTAIAILGAVIFILALSNFMTLIAYVVQAADKRQRGRDAAIIPTSNTAGDPEQGDMPQVVAHSFAGMEDKTAT